MLINVKIANMYAENLNSCDIILLKFIYGQGFNRLLLIIPIIQSIVELIQAISLGKCLIFLSSDLGAMSHFYRCISRYWGLWTLATQFMIHLLLKNTILLFYTTLQTFPSYVNIY